jgi:hypothetical protein
MSWLILTLFFLILIRIQILVFIHQLKSLSQHVTPKSMIAYLILILK